MMKEREVDDRKKGTSTKPDPVINYMDREGRAKIKMLDKSYSCPYFISKTCRIHLNSKPQLSHSLKSREWVFKNYINQNSLNISHTSTFKMVCIAPVRFTSYVKQISTSFITSSDLFTSLKFQGWEKDKEWNLLFYSWIARKRLKLDCSQNHTNAHPYTY